jgi:VanZ family protein
MWTLAIVVLSGNLGSPPRTLGIFKWVISWIVNLDLHTLESLHFYFRKALHVMCYGVLTVLWYRALMASCPERPGANKMLALAFTLIVAITDEGRQYLSPGRTASWWDVGLDMTGGVLFLTLIAWYWGRKNRLPSQAEPPPL